MTVVNGKVSRRRNAQRWYAALLVAAALVAGACGQKAGVHTLAARSDLGGAGAGGDQGLGPSADAGSTTGAAGQGVAAGSAASGRTGSAQGATTAAGQKSAGGAGPSAGGAQGAGDTTGVSGDSITVGVHGPVT